MSGRISERHRLQQIEKEMNEMMLGGTTRSRARWEQCLTPVVLAFAATLVLMLAMAATATAAAPTFSVRTDFPDTATAGQLFRAGVYVENAGRASMSGPVTVTVDLPGSLSLVETGLVDNGPDGRVEFAQAEIELVGPGSASCSVDGQTVTCTIDGDALRPAAQKVLKFPLQVARDASGDLVSQVEVSGGGVADPVQREEAIHVGPPEPFHLEAVAASVFDLNGGNELQAGAAPGSSGSAFELPTYADILYHPREFFIPGVFATGAQTWNNVVPEHPRNVVVHAPPGMVANFQATPVRCTAVQLNAVSSRPACPEESQVGVAHVNANNIVAVYSMVPPRGVPAQFGFSVVGIPVMINARVRPSDSGVDLVTENTNSSIPLFQIDVSLWGVPADSSHDGSRGDCLYGENGNSTEVEPDGLCETGAPRKAFLRLPTSCTGPLTWTTEMDTYEHPGVYHRQSTTTPAQAGCNQLEFDPSFEVEPSTDAGDSPAGLHLKLHLPQNEDPDGLAEAHLKDLTLAFPEGLVVNSASADGLGACSPGEIGLLSAVGEIPARFDGSAPRCPDASKLGSIRVNTPAIDHPLPGAVYLASQGKNPFGSLLALYLVVKDPETGVLIKVPVRTDLDPKTGRVTTVVSDGPQLPFEDFEVELDKGSRAPLRTPIACGSFSATATATPWSAPEGKDAHPSNSFQITRGAGGGSCVGSPGQAPFDPAVSAGTVEPKAGAFSPYAIKISRADGSQELGTIDLNLPKGLLASLRGIPYCSDSSLASVSGELGSGAAEMATSSCPAASQIGSVSAAVGAGPAPLNVNTGKAYLAGPYKGAPLSMAVIFPAVAGPFDLGNVVVRTALYVDPETAQIAAKSDPLPNMLKGIPLDIRSVRIDLDRPNFGLNPTSCDPMSIDADLASSLGASAHRSERFQVGGCDNLSFKPKLGLRLKGGTKRGKYPALTATLTFPKKLGTNVAKASVALPHSEFLAQNHIGTICTRVQFKAHACPQRSIYGYARAYSPLLDDYLEGPVYLRSSSNELPDLVADLNGQIEVALVGRIDTTKAAGIRTTFESVPDAPVSKFVLKMRGGKKGLLQNSTDICRGTHRVTALFEAHSGESVQLRPELKAGCGKGKKKPGSKARH